MQKMPKNNFKILILEDQNLMYNGQKIQGDLIKIIDQGMIEMGAEEEVGLEKIEIGEEMITNGVEDLHLIKKEGLLIIAKIKLIKLLSLAHQEIKSNF